MTGVLIIILSALCGWGAFYVLHSATIFSIVRCFAYATIVALGVCFGLAYLLT